MTIEISKEIYYVCPVHGEIGTEDTMVYTVRGYGETPTICTRCIFDWMLKQGLPAIEQRERENKSLVDMQG